MADWEANSLRLAVNLRRILRQARDHSKVRRRPKVEQARQWHVEIMRGLNVPPPGRDLWIGRFRGESGMENVGVRIGASWGVDPKRIELELGKFEERLQTAVLYLDERIPCGELPSDDMINAVIELMSWVHGEWARIHPFANGNGRTARIWANWVAMRYGLPPFVRLRPRPEGTAYSDAAALAMRGDFAAMSPVFHAMLNSFLRESE